MKVLLAVCLWLFNAGALADPVPLFTAGPPIPADDLIYRVTEHIEHFETVHAVVLNPAAFGANVVTVDINGQVHTFVIRPSDLHATGQTLWEGEENDDTFEMRPDIGLRRSDKGALSASFFLPPRSYFSIDSRSPTRIVEFESDWSVRRVPFWLDWLRLAAILLIVGSASAVGTAFVWHRDESRPSTASRLALADATIFGGTVLLFALGASCIDRTADWNPAHLDMRVVWGVLFCAAAGTGVVFWRVTAAYAAAVVSFWRAAREGLLVAMVPLHLLLAAAELVDAFRGRWQNAIQVLAGHKS